LSGFCGQKAVWQEWSRGRRLSTGAGNFYAQVAGDVILHKGKAMSPRQFTVAATGEARNAWRDIAIWRPGDKHWRIAVHLRRECGLDDPKKRKTRRP